VGARRIHWVFWTVFVLVVPSAFAFEGFGASTPGGSGGEIVHVTNLDSSGDGSLREAVSEGNRTVVFDVAGTIRGSVTIGGSYVTIDGTSAPPPGITITGRGLYLGDNHDLVVRGIRVRNASGDGIHVGDNGSPGRVYNVVIDHVSVDGSSDGNIDITGAAHDVTVSWSILSRCFKNMLIKYGVQRVTLHHNIFVNSQYRNPWISYDDRSASNVSPGTEVDMRNNLVWHWGNLGGGTGVECGAKANLVNNFYSSPATISLRQGKAIILERRCRAGAGGLAFTSGNFDPDPGMENLDSTGNQPSPFPAVPVNTADACSGAHETLIGAGAPPLDSVDQDQIAGIVLPGAC
jgi:hypothetical protein